MIANLNDRRVYADANVFIYAVEAHGAVSLAAQHILETVCDVTGLAHTSEPTLAEGLVQPLRRADGAVAELYTGLLCESAHIVRMPITRSILQDAARIRAESTQELPDAIHIASALQAGCGAFVSQDRRLRLPSPLEAVVPSELSSENKG